jgi:hypothetical protein
MRAYLLKGLSLVCMIACTMAVSYESIDYNEDVNRKIMLDQTSVMEVISEIKFRANSNPNAATYYFVVPKHLEENLVHINAEETLTGEEIKVKRIDSIPASVLSKYTDKNASDVTFYQLNLRLQKGSVVFTIKELYKRRKSPFPSIISIREQEEHLLKFVDSKYLISLYPTKSQKLNIIYDTTAFL